MKHLQNYINEQLSKEEQGGNVLIYKTNEYNLYCGKHLFDRLNRDSNETYNTSDKIKLSWIKQIVNKGFSTINNLCGNRLKINDPNSAINLISIKHGSSKLNVVCYIGKVEIDGIIDIIIKTTKFENNFWINKRDNYKIVENYEEFIVE